MPHILLVEDEPAIADAVLFSLQAEGWTTHWSSLLSDAKQHWAQADLVVLDVGLPDGSGFDFCKELRKHSDVPVLFLTARHHEIDRVVGLELGADDYISKPFSPRELVARVRANLKRWQRPVAHATAIQPTSSPISAVLNTATLNTSVPNTASPNTSALNSTAPNTAAPHTADLRLEHAPPQHQATHQVGDFCWQPHSCRVWLAEQPLQLTALEYRLLTSLLAQPEHVLNREQLLHAGGQSVVSGYERNIDTHIKSLRAKCKAISPKAYIQTVRGFGYRLQPAGAPDDAASS